MYALTPLTTIVGNSHFLCSLSMTYVLLQQLFHAETPQPQMTSVMKCLTNLVICHLYNTFNTTNNLTKIY